MKPGSLHRELFDDGVICRLMCGRTINPEKGCWEWSGFRNEAGYGQIRVGGRRGWTERCHRVAYALHIGPVDRGVRILHRCDNPSCFNPFHLFAGSAKDNTDDMLAKGRWRKPRVAVGESSLLAKLTEQQARDAIQRSSDGESRASIAHSFGVTIGAISRIALGKNWKHITGGVAVNRSTRGTKREAANV